MSGFTNGFPLKFDGPEQDLHSENSTSAKHNPQIIEKTIQYELSLNRISGPYDSPPLQNFKSSPLAIREKKHSGKYRMLHNLSYPYDAHSVNHNISRQFTTVTYSSVKDAVAAINACQPTAYMAKTDLSEAYRQVPIHPSDYHLTGFSWNEKYYYDKCLPQGCSSSCQTFQRISNGLLWILKNKFGLSNIVNVLDDFLFVGSSHKQCKDSLHTFITLANELGIPLAPNKTVGPTTNIVFLGVQLNTEKMTASLPSEKINRYVADLSELQNHRKITLRQLRSIIGKLQFATSVIRPGRPFLRRLINKTIGITKPHFYIRLGSEELKDMAMWTKFLTSYNGITILRPPSTVSSATINLYTDASAEGFGGTYGTSWIQEHYPDSWKSYHISVLEIYPIYVLIKLFAKKIVNADLTFHCDNEAVVTVINKQTSKNPYLLKIIRLVVLEQLKHNFTLQCVHIPGLRNILADRISRFQVNFQLLNQYGMQPFKTQVPAHLMPANFNFNSLDY